jgi:hypothetical protein
MDGITDIFEGEDAVLTSNVIDALCEVVEATSAVHGRQDEEESRLPAAASAASAAETESMVREVLVLLGWRAFRLWCHLSNRPAWVRHGLQLTLAVRGILEKYEGRQLGESTKVSLLRDLENVLYDEMIFDRIIEQVDRSYAVSASRQPLGQASAVCARLWCLPSPAGGSQRCAAGAL